MPGGRPDDPDAAGADGADGAVATAAAVDTASPAPGDTVVEEPARRGPRRVRTGDTLGRYELGDELGEGGMATVFRARDRELRRDVALKVLFPHLARRPEIVRRFHREARAAAGLDHPNVLRIYDVGNAGGDDPPYIVMELVRGPTLLQAIKQRGAMLAEVAACIGALLADALAAAHAFGIIHRDVKPGNVLIAPGGRLLLADFGVARLETEDSLVTRTGALLGTPAYMSPEQARGETATVTSDLYSLGATLYQLATGALPYTGPPARMLSLIAEGNLVAPVRRRSSCGPDLSRLIERLMAVDPGARPATATAIAAELRALAAGGGLGDPGEELAAYFEGPDGFLRARTPVVVATVVAAARAAMADDKLPRAMALADRASALAPDDPEVVAVVRAVAEGGHASRRKRALALSGVGLAAAGGAAVLGWQLSRGLIPESPLDSSRAPDVVTRVVADAAPEVRGTRVEAALDAALAPAAPADAASAPSVMPVDGGTRGADRRRPPIARDAALRALHDAAVALVDAAPAIDAVALPEGPALDAGAAPAATGHIVVHNDVWCNLWIDGNFHGNRRNEPIEVAAGHHAVRCVNPAIGEWTKTTEVAPGVTQTLTGTLLDEIDVTLAVDATIDGKHYARGTVLRLKPRNIEVIAGGKKQFITFRASCTLRDLPELGCYL